MKSAEEVLALAQQVGLPDDMSPELWAHLETQVYLEEERGSDPYLGLAIVEFDTETIDSPGASPDDYLGSYTDIIQLLADNSDGKFIPSAIIDELIEDNAYYRVGFTHESNAFEVKVQNQGDCFQGEVVESVTSFIPQFSNA